MSNKGGKNFSFLIFFYFFQNTPSIPYNIKYYKII